MRQAAKTDANQTSIVKALRSVGCTVQTLAAVGNGCPDILVGFRGSNYLMEIKDGDKVPSKRRLTPDQVEWHRQWFGKAVVIKSIDEALEALK